MTEKEIKERAELFAGAARMAIRAAEEEVDEESGSVVKRAYIDSILNVNPSGKYYMPWTTNQSAEDINDDDLFWEEVERILDFEGIYVTSGEGDGLDVVAEMWVRDVMEDEV